MKVYYLCSTDEGLVRATDLPEDYVSFGSWYLLEEASEYEFAASEGETEILCKLTRHGEICVAETPYGEVYFEAMGTGPWELVPADSNQLETLCLEHGFFFAGA